MIHYLSVYLNGSDRTESLNRLLPGLFTGKYSSVLYVGARIDRCDYLKELGKAGCAVTILEIFPPNAEHYRVCGWDVIQGDVRTAELSEYEVVFWWHGPEHIPQEDVAPALNRLEKVATRAVVIGCPWGIYHLDPDYGNPHEEHLSHHDYVFFEQRGYVTECLGNRDTAGSNITSVKYL